MLTQLVVFLFKKIAKCPKKYKKFCKLLSLAKIYFLVNDSFTKKLM